MKRFCALLLFFGMAAAAPGADRGLSNEQLQVRVGSDPHTMLEYLGKKGVNQLHQDAKGDGLLAGLGGNPGPPREGLQIAVRTPEGEPLALEWKVIRQEPGAIRLRDTTGRFEAVLSLPEAASAVDLQVIPLTDTPPAGRLELIWHLQVGGDFLAVTTEGVADVETVPTRDAATGAARLLVAEIERDQNISHPLSQPWFAVSDRNQDVTFAVWFDAPASGVSLHGWSGQLLGREAMSRTLSLPPPTAPLRVRMMLLEPFNRPVAVLREGALRWSAKDTLVFLPVAPVKEGQVRLLAGEAPTPVLNTSFVAEKPLQPETFTLQNHPAKLAFELRTGEGLQKTDLLE
ncbi:MAG TPA: hypothetical protein VNQ90_02320 [Chthoniobacteraceae bacterium]|nr:hypothetical protein [Chthoniobacteraceae bacterium]